MPTSATPGCRRGRHHRQRHGAGRAAARRAAGRRPGRSAKPSSTSSSRWNSRWRGPRRMTDSADPGPVFLLDHYDNAACGGHDGHHAVLAEIMRQRLDNVAAFGIFDPQAVQQCIDAGIGATLTLSHRRQADDADVPRAERAAAGHRPRQDDLRRQVPRQGPDGGAARSRTWAMRWCWTPAGSRSCCSRAMSSPSTSTRCCQLGIDPMQKRYVMLKSRIHWRAGMSAPGQGRGRMRRASASAPPTTASIDFKHGAPADLPARSAGDSMKFSSPFPLVRPPRRPLPCAKAR